VEKINVLVTSVGGFSHGSSIVTALQKSFLPFNIVGTDMSPRLINSSPLKQKEVIPAACAADFIDNFIKLIKKYSIDCIFTGSEQELLKVSECSDEIEANKVKIFLNSKNVIATCKNKLKCNQTLSSLGFDVPQTILVKNAEDCERINFFPAIIKPYLITGASANVFLADDKEELRLIITYLLNKQIDIVVQEYLPYDQNEYTVGVTSLLEEPRVVSSIALRKFIEGPTAYIKRKSSVISSGITQGEFKDYSNIRKTCEKIAEKLESRGPMNIQLREIKGKVMPFEINPRFSGTTSARAMNGYNEPEYYIRRYIMHDPKAADSLVNANRGFVVKSLNEQYFKYD